MSEQKLSEQDQILNEFTEKEYKFGFTTDIETEYAQKDSMKI